MEESPRTERPKPPFTTSTMQQDAGSRLGWGAQITMRVAQRLYENGYITYMRTDSINLSQQGKEEPIKFTDLGLQIQDRTQYFKVANAPYLLVVKSINVLKIEMQNQKK